MWQVLIPVPVGGGDPVTYQIRAQSSQIPGRSNDDISLPYMQTAGIVVAGKLAFPHKWACTFIEGEDKLVFDAIHSWQQLIVHDVAGIGVGDPSYKTDVYITLLTTQGDTFMALKIKGAWIQQNADLGLTYAAGDGTVKYAVTFTYDSWEDAT